MPGKAEVDGRYDSSYTSCTKTAISIPDPLFRAAERVAKRQKVSRSRFYAKAVAAYLKSQSDQCITEGLNAAYATDDTSLDPDLTAAAYHIFAKEKW